MPRVAKRSLTVVLLVVSIMAASVTPALAGTAGGGNINLSDTDAAPHVLDAGKCEIYAIAGGNDVLLIRAELVRGVPVEPTSGVRIPVPGTSGPQTNQPLSAFRSCSDFYSAGFNQVIVTVPE